MNTMVNKHSVLEQLGIDDFQRENINRPLLYMPEYIENSKL
jgi:hypothetical protein